MCGVSRARVHSHERLFADGVRLPGRVALADPLAIGEKTKEEIAWFRHAEIKHGRIAMAAFVGFLVQTVGLQFPGQLTKGMTFADLAATGGPADQWDALPTGGKLQILLVVGALEVRALPLASPCPLPRRRQRRGEVQRCARRRRTGCSAAARLRRLGGVAVMARGVLRRGCLLCLQQMLSGVCVSLVVLRAGVR